MFGLHYRYFLNIYLQFFKVFQRSEDSVRQ